MQSRQEIVHMIEQLKFNFNYKDFDQLKTLLFLLQSNMTFFNSADEEINQRLLEVLNIACMQINENCRCDAPRPPINNFLSSFSTFHMQ